MCIYLDNKQTWPTLCDLSTKEKITHIIFDNKYKYKIKNFNVSPIKKGWSSIIILENNVLVIFDSTLNENNKLIRLLTIQNPNGEQIIRRSIGLDENILKNWWIDIQDFGIKQNIFQKIINKIKNIFFNII